MKKFNIIEEGRLSKSEMAEINGGGYLCFKDEKRGYTVWESCGKETTGSYSQCMKLYMSCNNDNKLSCFSYKGSTGPGGNMTGDGIPPSQSATERDDYVVINWD